jgi:hypothetical protein
MGDTKHRLLPNVEKTKIEIPKREQCEFGKSRDSETKDPQLAFCVCVTTIVLPTVQAKNRCLQTTHVSKGGASGFARQLGYLFHRRSIEDYLYE